LSAAERRSLSNQMKVNGLHYCGLHSFLKAPAGLHLTTPDAAVRTRTWEYFVRLIDLAADLGPSPVMVLGSSNNGKQSTTRRRRMRPRLAEGSAKRAPGGQARRHDFSEPLIYATW
jgi:sugar phosphate isomerase/epimerase